MNSNNVKSLPLPPFGKILLAYQDEGIRLTDPIYIYVGPDAKKTAYINKQDRELCCYLPYGHDFKDYRWPIFDQSVVVDCIGLTPISFLKKMILTLFSMYYPRQIMYHFQGMKSDDCHILRRDDKRDMTSNDSMEAKFYA